jgi:hypothetical protein
LSQLELVEWQLLMQDLDMQTLLILLLKAAAAAEQAPP